MDKPLTCRIDVHKGDLYFGVGCMQLVSDYSVANGKDACPDIPDPRTLRHL